MNRCGKCGRRLLRDETEVAHEFSGRCLARARGVEHGDTTSSRRFASDHAVGGGNPRNPRGWGAGAQKGSRYNVPEPEHGTYSRYASKKHRCRCGLCRAASAAYNRARMANNTVAHEQRKALQREWAARKRAEAR